MMRSLYSSTSLRHVLCAALPLALVGCGSISSLMGGKKSATPASSSSQAADDTSNAPSSDQHADARASDQHADAPASGGPSAAHADARAPEKFTDQDEGNVGPLQESHQGEVVFANVVIERKSGDAKALVTRTNLDRPLFLRAYLPKTPAAIFHEKGLSCGDSDRRLYFFAKLAGTTRKYPYELAMTELIQNFPVIRSQTLTDPEGDNIISVVPTKPFTLDAEANPAAFEFMQLASEMKPGENTVDVELHVGCDARGALGRETLVGAKGRMVFDVKPADLSKLTSRIRLRPGNASATQRLRPLYSKLLVPGAKLVAFEADATTVDTQVKKETDLRIMLHNADNTCSYTIGRWVEPYLGAGRYDTGNFEAVTAKVYPMPCR